MAVVTGSSDLYPASPAGSNVPDPAKARGKKRAITFSVANAASDSSGSVYKLGKIPADCILDAESAVRTDTWGFATVQIGIVGFATALGNAARGAATTILSPVSQATDILGQPAWQALGLAAAPANNELEIIATAVAAATGAGVMTGKISYRHHN